jgi:hypothetical protein
LLPSVSFPANSYSPGLLAVSREYILRALAIELQPTSLPPLRFNVKRDDLCHSSISVSISLLGAPIYSADRGLT